jgi:hypothetical protein
MHVPQPRPHPSRPVVGIFAPSQPPTGRQSFEDFPLNSVSQLHPNDGTGTMLVWNGPLQHSASHSCDTFGVSGPMQPAAHWPLCPHVASSFLAAARI